MSPTLTPEQVKQIITNQHPNPTAILGAHPITEKGDQQQWVIRAYLPKAEAAWVYLPEAREEYPMHSIHDPHFFECILDTEQPINYQLRVKEGAREHLILDPYTSPYLTDYDIDLFSEGNHHRIYEKLGAHPTTQDGVTGVYFATWAPNAKNISVIGSFNQWDENKHPMELRQNGIWEIFIPHIGSGEAYQYVIAGQNGEIYKKSDPYGFQQEVRPNTASIITDLNTYTWQDQEWLEQRRNYDPLKSPISVYEVHLGSWLQGSVNHPPESLNGTLSPVKMSAENTSARFLTYYELAQKLIPYVKELGYTHIEILPLAEHPFDGSWGYQVTGYYACTSRYGTPHDFMYFVDQCHQNGIGVILDWVPGHFSKDSHGLSLFDGTPLYEHPDPRRGEHKEWGTYVFNYACNEVRNFLVANALFWFDKYHVDGIRVDAVASMLYLDYQREEGEWLPNEYGGRENLDAVAFLRQANYLLFSYFPGVVAIAEESTAWPMVSWPTYTGGLGFNLKWNMGWMHDMLDYFSMDPWFRQFHQNNLTFSMWYHHSENYMLALSHDEVVHEKRHLLGKMPGDEWQKFANLRALFAFMFTHPGKKTLFASMEFGQWREWSEQTALDWELLEYPFHHRLKQYVGDLNQLYCREKALYEQDFTEEGFSWIDCNDHRHSVVSFIRRAEDASDFLVIVCNFTPQPHSHYRVGVPETGFYREIFNSDSREYGGSNMGNLGGKWTQQWRFHEQPYSLDLCLPPLAVVIFQLDPEKTTATEQG
ncbi:1,4-alpha-glucan branching protein GlgB [Euhalothece natronophila Z-M001]|uniref:1,4-alpha-glucan branching enzyme GlgB n=1 Tax=Euhalothece natronophila Z-M001 TaxID=522448 RepID=A0A5B8NKN5_9CHRO|nr:1,4-alpha-glucan branching protein GlgB [Euhalothece natronophila]QDZ38875.1 1,4-alpha-glucan branching protein GlgB [Euhalothece natronophila Z-M001]